MKLPVVLRPEVEQDLLLTKDWYERQKAGLGDRFAAQVSVVFDQWATTPEMFAAH